MVPFGPAVTDFTVAAAVESRNPVTSGPFMNHAFSKEETQKTHQHLTATAGILYCNY